MSSDTQPRPWGLLPLAILTALGAAGGFVVGAALGAGVYGTYGLMSLGALAASALYFFRGTIVPALWRGASWLVRHVPAVNLRLCRHLLVTLLGLWGLASAAWWLVENLSRDWPLELGLVICGTVGACVILRRGWVGLLPVVRQMRQARHQRARHETSGSAHAGLTAAAESVMTLWCGAPVELRLQDVLVSDPRAAHLLLRCRVTRGPREAPASVVLKQARMKRRGVFNEWASLILASELPGLKRVLPVLHGGDRQLDLLVLEDLGSGPTLRELLAGANAGLAEAALVEQAETLAHIHAASAGGRGRMAKIRASLAGERFESDGDLGVVMREGIRGALAGLALTPPDGLDEELAGAAARLDEPAALDVFLLRDTRPGNWLRPWLELRPCDFERSCFGLATLDLAGIALGNLEHPECLDLPAALRHRMIETYRESLAHALPTAASPAVFEPAFAAAAASWLATILTRVPEAEAEREPGSTAAGPRRRVVTALQTFLELPVASTELPILHRTAMGLHERARARWGDALEPLPCYPAFASPKG